MNRLNKILAGTAVVVAIGIGSITGYLFGYHKALKETVIVSGKLIDTTRELYNMMDESINDKRKIISLNKEPMKLREDLLDTSQELLDTTQELLNRTRELDNTVDELIDNKRKIISLYGGYEKSAPKSAPKTNYPIAPDKF